MLIMPLGLSATSFSFVSYIEFTVHTFFTSHMDYCNTTTIVGNLAHPRTTDIGVSWTMPRVSLVHYQHAVLSSIIVWPIACRTTYAYYKP